MFTREDCLDDGGEDALRMVILMSKGNMQVRSSDRTYEVDTNRSVQQCCSADDDAMLVGHMHYHAHLGPGQGDGSTKR